VVTLAAHRGGQGPILEDEQFAAAIPGVAPHGYGLMWGATVSEIVDSTAPATVELDDATGLMVGADVMFVRLDDAGEPLAMVELTSPSGIDVSGVIVRPFDTARGGSRNWLANPLMRGSVGPEVAVGRWSAGTGSSIDVTGLPASTTWLAGSQVMVTGNGSGGITPRHYLQGSRLSTNATSNGSGEVTLSLVSALSATASTSLPPVYILPAPALPAGWETVDGGAASNRMATVVVPSTARGVLSGTTVGAQNYSATAPYIQRRVVLEGLTAGDRIYPGDLIEAASGLGMMAMEEVVVEADAPAGTPPSVFDDAVGYWRFGMWNGAGNIPDESGGGHDAIFPGGAANPVSRGGGYPGLYFDGSGQYLRVPYDADFDFGASDDFTVVAVIRGPVSKPGPNFLVGKLRPTASRPRSWWVASSPRTTSCG
jgi:hypothetical protein